MLVLALEFSRGAPARDSRRSADHIARRTGAYGASGRRALAGCDAASPEGDPAGRSLKTEERKPGLATVVDQSPDGLPCPGELHMEAQDDSLAGVGGGPDPVG